MLLYIDPGTGSMLLTILIGMISILYFFFQKVRIRLKSIIRGSRVKNDDKGHMPYVIYSDSKRYWNVFKPICDIFEEKKIPLVYWTSSPDDPALVEDYQYVKREFIGEVNRAVARLNMMNAGICLSTTPGLDVYQWKRSKNTKWYVHIGHGAIDYSTYRMFGTDYYDAVFLVAEYQREEIRELERKHNCSQKELPLAGLTYLDTMKERLYSDKNCIEKDNRLTVLLAPSWGASSILCKYGKNMIESLIKTGFHIIIRPHPQSLTSDKEVMDLLLKEYPDNKDIEWNFDNDNYEVLKKSDIMISDFSGVIFDYVFIFDKPVIYADTSFDPGPYDAWWTDRKLWVFETLPKVGVELQKEDLADLKSVIEKALSNDELKKSRIMARESGWQNIGKCAQTVVNYMINKYDELSLKEERS